MDTFPRSFSFYRVFWCFSRSETRLRVRNVGFFPFFLPSCSFSDVPDVVRSPLSLFPFLNFTTFVFPFFPFPANTPCMTYTLPPLLPFSRVVQNLNRLIFFPLPFFLGSKERYFLPLFPQEKQLPPFSNNH